jgi:mono/diheme cytochrome c family protein
MISLVLLMLSVLWLAPPGQAAAVPTRTLYLRKCAVCHGRDGSGKTLVGRRLKIGDVHGYVAKHSEDEMVKIIHDGMGRDMDGYANELTAEQMRALAHYYRSLAK